MMCSYCGCADLEVIGRFMAEHEHIVNHLGELRRSLGDEPRRLAAVEQLAAHLDPHVTAEEAGLFTVMARDELFTDHIGALCAEHDELDGLLARIGAGQVEHFAHFERLLREHIDREDNGLFPAAAIHLGGPEWAEVDTLTRTRGGVSGGNYIGS
jgi:hemerythrin-like domain-containing protein